MNQQIIYFIDKSLEEIRCEIVLCVTAMVWGKASGGDGVVAFSTLDLRNCTNILNDTTFPMAFERKTARSVHEMLFHQLDLNRRVNESANPRHRPISVYTLDM